MKISIAVPSYNYAQYLRQCLESIKKQDFSNFEVLIADGGSSDDSLDIIKKFCDDDARFRLVSIVDDGQADSICKAFSQATGDVLCFLNADDVFLCSDVLSQVVDTFSKYKGIDVVSFGGYYIDANGKYLKPVKLRYHPLDSAGWMRYRTAVLQPATFWQKRVQDCTSIDAKYHYVFDVVFFYQIFTKFSWLELNNPIVGHRLHGVNKSLQINHERIMELAQFERLKFGRYSCRAAYLLFIAVIVYGLDKIPFFNKALKKIVYCFVNSLSFISFYRIPSI
jgi:glycosyltransferase involved in cell wall biosynthesis